LLGDSTGAPRGGNRSASCPSGSRATAGIGRNLAIDVLEFFDRSGLTRRRGDARMLVGSAEALFGPASAGASTGTRAVPDPGRG
jgi:selenocysteine-specific elongation factor